MSAGSLFLYAERLFNAWDQRPVYKSHTATVSSLRRCKPPVDPVVLRSIVGYFATADATLHLDPEYESEREPGEENPDKAKKREDASRFKLLRDARLLECCGGADLYWAAMNSKDIQLTLLGRYYWRLLSEGKV